MRAMKHFQRLVEQTSALGLLSGLENHARESSDFRRVVYTGPNVQVALMSLLPGESVGVETHEGTEQFFLVSSGQADAELDGVVSKLVTGDALPVRPGVTHNLTNNGLTPLKLVTLYSPPQHAPGTVHATKADALAAE